MAEAGNANNRDTKEYISIADTCKHEKISIGFIYFMKQWNINQNGNKNLNANMFEIEMSVEHKNACRDEYTNTQLKLGVLNSSS